MQTWMVRAVCGGVMIAGLVVLAQQKGAPPTPAQSMINNVTGVNTRLLEMARDFPENKYDFKPTPEVRSFGEVLLHVMAGNQYGAKVANGVAGANWGKEEEAIEAMKMHGKAQIVAAFEKAANDTAAGLKAMPPESFTKTLAPWPSILEHNGEHYGQLVVYYRLNGLVPPASRPKK